MGMNRFVTQQILRQPTHLIVRFVQLCAPQPAELRSGVGLFKTLKAFGNDDLDGPRGPASKPLRLSFKLLGTNLLKKRNIRFCEVELPDYSFSFSSKIGSKLFVGESFTKEFGECGTRFVLNSLLSGLSAGFWRFGTLLFHGGVSLFGLRSSAARLSTSGRALAQLKLLRHQTA